MSDYTDKTDKYKFNEDVALTMLHNHIQKTYESHYSKNQFQSTEFVFDAGHGEGFCIGNIMKYAARYGKKEGVTKQQDLLKIIHYGIILLGREVDNESY